MNKVGLYGLGVMGTSLAENIYRHGFSLSVYNIEVQKAIQFAKNKDGVMACESLEAFVNSLAKPRVIILMVTAGKAVDDRIAFAVLAARRLYHRLRQFVLSRQ